MLRHRPKVRLSSHRAGMYTAAATAMPVSNAISPPPCASGPVTSLASGPRNQTWSIPTTTNAAPQSEAKRAARPGGRCEDRFQNERSYAEKRPFRKSRCCKMESSVSTQIAIAQDAQVQMRLLAIRTTEIGHLGTHLDEQDGDKDRAPVPEQAEKVAQRTRKVCSRGDGDREVDGRADDREEEPRQSRQEREDDLEREREGVLGRGIVGCASERSLHKRNT